MTSRMRKSGRRGVMRLGVCWLVCCLAAAGVLVAKAVEPAPAPAPGTVASRTVAATSTGPWYLPIEQIGVGQRVVTPGTDPLRPNPTAVNPVTWRLARLEIPHFHGTDDVLTVALLRPSSVIAGWRPGQSVTLSIPEIGAVGEANVLDVEPCPALVSGPGRVVTGTFTHNNATIRRLKLRGVAAPLEVTGLHPLYSESRNAFVRAQSLMVGETLRTRWGTVRVESLIQEPHPRRVYNLEVEGEHAYYVTADSVLCHNGCVKGPYKDPEPPGYNNGATHDDHVRARSLGGGDEPANHQPLPAETNVRTGGHEGQLGKDRDDLIAGGLTKEQAESVLNDEIESLGKSPPPRPMDPRIIDTLPDEP